MRRLLLFVLVCAPAACAQSVPDPALWAQIKKIPAIDNHTHAMKVTAPGEHDEEFDALPCETLEPSGAPTMTRPDNPAFVQAWKALYAYPYGDTTPEHLKALREAQQRVKAQQGDNFPTWVLDRLNTRILFANRIRMGRGLQGPRFRWVPFDDALLFPLNNRGMADTPDRRIFYDSEDHLLLQYMLDARLPGFPPTLDEYVAKLVVPTLERQARAGAVAIKFEAAYLRALDFAPAEHDRAAGVYEQFVRKPGQTNDNPPAGPAYKALQDYLFHVIAENAGRLGMAVHLHTGAGCGGYFQLAGANPALLEPDLDDPALRKTQFVLLHGGWPFTREAAFLAGKPNVWTDSSEGWMVSPRKLAGSMRSWLEWFPEHVLFGTDLYGLSDEIGWEVVGWQAGTGGRYALALALTGMMQDGEITRPRALQLAHMVLHGNAEKLYGLK